MLHSVTPRTVISGNPEIFNCFKTADIILDLLNSCNNSAIGTMCAIENSSSSFAFPVPEFN